MAGSFSMGVMITGAVSGAFASSMGNATRALEKINGITKKLRIQQDLLSQATTRYGEIGGKTARRLKDEFSQVSTQLMSLEKKQRTLSASANTSRLLRQERTALIGRGIAAYGAGRALWSTVSPAIKQSMVFDDNMQDMAITAKYDNKTRDILGGNIRQWGKQYNQTHSALQTATKTLISNNIDDLNEIRAYMPDIAKGATATRASAQDWANVAVTSKQVLDIPAKEFGQVQNMMSFGGDQGSFEIDDQAKWFPSIASQMKGIAEGKEAIAEMVAGFQIARMGTSNSDEAANNFKNYLSKIFAPDTQQRFKNVGIDLNASLMDQKAKGISPIEGMANVVEHYLKKQSPQAVAKFKAALQIDDNDQRDAALRALQDNFGLGELFTDRQVMDYLRPMLANRGKYKEIKQGTLRSAPSPLMDAAAKKRLESPLEKMKQLMIATHDLGLTIGKQLTPVVMGVTSKLTTWAQASQTFLQAHPSIVSSIVNVSKYCLVFYSVLTAVRFGVNFFVLTPLLAMKNLFSSTRESWRLLSKGVTGGVSIMTKSFFFLTKGIRTMATGLVSGVKWISKFSLVAARLGVVLAGRLLTGIKLVSQGVIWLGRAMLMNPIGLVITGIAVSAFLIYRYWKPISQWFVDRWTDIKQAFAGGIGGVSRLIINWSPLGLFYQVFAGVMKYFNIDLPDKFSEFGGNLIDGLVSGIQNKWISAKESIIGLGDSISGWFKENLKINSPSRVFMGFGEGIVEGTTLGIARGFPQAQDSISRLSALMMPEEFSSPLPPFLADATRLPAMPSGSHMTVNFSPVINIDGQRQVQDAQLNQALGLSVRELEQMLNRVLYNQQRRGFA